MKVSDVVQECCQLGNATWHVGPKDGGVGVVHRTYGAACSQVDGGIACGNLPPNICFYGPCGSHNFPIGGPPAHVFKPFSNPEVCGWQAGGPDGGYDPEPFTKQTPYPDVPAECPYTSCLANAGIPLVNLKVTAITSGATGHVSTKPDGIDLQGADSVTASFSDTKVELTADLLGAHARAVFSGDCSATGKFGKSVKCKLTLGPDKVVTVTYECESGFSC